MAGERKPILNVFDDEVAVSEHLCSFIIEVANRAIEQEGRFTIGLSGNPLVNENPILIRGCGPVAVSVGDNKISSLQRAGLKPGPAVGRPDAIAGT